MGRIVTTILLFLFALQLQGTPKKVALIVAIGDYPEELGWRKIGSSNDVNLIKSALIHQGFKESDIRVIVDKDATKKGILEGIENLYKSAEKGGIVYFHYSGHGQQIIDKVGDEVDGLDESLVPIDAGRTYELCPAKGANHIRDDLLGELLTKIRRKVGVLGDVIVSLDACHSGTATRGYGVARGTSDVFAPTNYKPNPELVSNFGKSLLKSTDPKGVSPMVVISGSSSTELNYEYRVDGVNYGSLSYALSKTFHQLSSDFSYRALFGKVKVLMSSIAPRQTPQLEGSVDRLVFSGEAIAQKIYTTLRIWHNSENVLINAGQLNGITNNSTVGFYPIGTGNPQASTPISTGRVVNAQLTEALVKLNKPINKDQAERSWVFVEELGFQNQGISVKLSEKLPNDLINSFQKLANENTFLKIVEKVPDLIVDIEGSVSPVLKVFARDDMEIYSQILSKLEIDNIVNDATTQIKRYAQARLLRSLEADNKRIRVTFEMIPITLDNNFSEIDRKPLNSKLNSSGQLVFKSGDFFRIRITNNGDRAAYYSLLNIQADNAVNILVPEKDASGNPFRAPSDCRIEPGKSEELRVVFYIKKPYGQEVFKLISANRPLQLDQLVKTRGEVVDRGYLHPFEAIFADSFDLLSRGSHTYRLPPEFINIHTVVFNIVPVK